MDYESQTMDVNNTLADAEQHAEDNGRAWGPVHLSAVADGSGHWVVKGSAETFDGCERYIGVHYAELTLDRAGRLLDRMVAAGTVTVEHMMTSPHWPHCLENGHTYQGYCLAYERGEIDEAGRLRI